MAGLVQNQNAEKRMEKQSGCISGFLQIFDRHQILAGKRIHSTKRLPPSTGVGASPEILSSVQSPEFSGELRKQEPTKHVVVMPESPDRSQSSPSENATGNQLATPPTKSTPLIPMSEMKDGTQKCSWKSSKEMARLSLDSSANSKPSVVTDGGYDKQQRSSSVIARLMGLEPLSSSDHKPPQPVSGKPALRRSASESRVSRDPVHSIYIDGNNFQVKQPKQTVEHIVRDEGRNVSNSESVNGRALKSMGYGSGNLKSESLRTSPWKSPQQKRSFFDSEDFFPEPNPTTVSMHGDFEKKLKMRGMDEQSNDLGTLKQILEVLQLKGLLHSTRPSNGDRHRNFVYVRNLPSDESSIVLMKPWRSPASKVDNQISTNDSRGTRRYTGENSPAISPKREGGAVDRSARSPARARNSSPTRIESNLKSCNSIVKRKPLSIEIQRRANESSDSLRSSPSSSPKLTPKRTVSVNHCLNNRSPRNHKPSESSAINSTKHETFKNIVIEEESSSISVSTVYTPPPTDTEGNRQGRSLLQRCDKLLHNIAEMNSTTESPPIATTVLPSPVSVLDSGFDKDESSSPSHSIDFKVPPTVDYEDENCSRSISPTKSMEHEEFISDDTDFIYISEILRMSPYLHEDRSFSLAEKLYKSNDTSNVSKRQRKLVFDVIVEILDRNRQLPPWKAASLANSGSGTSLKQIWSEFQKIREINTGDGMLELISGVLKKDLIEINGWIDHPIETSDAILDIERMIFKDLVSEAIVDLAEFPAKRVFSRPQRKLVF
ncbi:protein LONGIFOLIA 1-like [Cynara cardunculus var. scolymus]|uniref:protein LONGIFOLIA 1-like n=1 Tax=Cynara cardunculus var. scolymus TaxID=59895 RepID=UPI000D628A26|nr:protein LONGIFOLIA 1-like [Cynara cardunculus var. scolymus]